MRRAVIIAAVLLTFARPACAAPLDVVRAAKIDAIVRTVMHGAGLSGLALGIVRSGAIVYARGYGEARGRAVGAATVMPIGSLTKSFTAAALLALARDGGVRLGDPLGEYVPEYPAAARVTLAQLLAMRSGIPDYSQLPGFDASARVPIAPEALVARVAPLPLDFTPGTRTEYSNTNYLLAALVVQRASGMPYAAYLHRELLDPLGLRATRLALRERRAFGCADLESNVPDLLRWLQALAAAGALPDGGEPYDDGFFSGTFYGRTVLYASGYVPRYSSYAFVLPRDGLTVVMLADGGPADLNPLARSIAAIALDIPEAAPETNG